MTADEGQLRALVVSAPEPVLVVDGGRLVLANAAAAQLLGLPADELPTLPAWNWTAEADRELVAARHARLLAETDTEPVLAEDLLSDADGSHFPVETMSSTADLEGRRVVLVRARTVPRSASTSAEKGGSRFVETFRKAPAPLLLLDRAGSVLEANAAAVALFGDTSTGLIGRSLLERLHPEDRRLVRTWLLGLLEGAVSTTSGERRLLLPDGTITWVYASMARLPGEPSTVVAHLLDVSERRETEARLAHQALHDPLTGLPNRALLFDRLAQAVRAATRGGPGVTVLYLDLDRFKTINDTRGHAVGDRVLQVVADRLARVLRPADTVARLGGDEFAVVAEGLPPDAAGELAERVADAISEPVPLGDGGASLPIATSIGVAHSAHVLLDVDALLTAADAAMYRAKQRTRGGESPA